MAFTKDGSQLVVLFPPGEAHDLGGADAQITIRDAATLEPIGLSIEPEAFVGAYVGFYYASPQFALAADDRSLITASEDGELAWWDLRSRKRTRTLKIGTGLHALARQPGRSHRGGRHRARSAARRPTFRNRANGNRRVLPGARTGCCSARTARRSCRRTRRDRDPLGRRVGELRETLRGHSNYVQQPVFSPDGETLYTVSHDGTAIAWDLTGDRRLGRPFTFTHDRTFSQLAMTATRGVQPRRPANRCRPEGARGSRSGTRASSHRSGRPFSKRTARSRRSPSHRMGKRSPP